MVPGVPVTKTGFSVRSTQVRSMLHDPYGYLPDVTTEFRAPGTIVIENPYADGSIFAFELYVSPSRPGFCNHVSRIVIVKDKNGKMPLLFTAFTIPWPKWFSHVISSLFIHQVRSR
jgi:Pheophorbide a oxygenase